MNLFYNVRPKSHILFEKVIERAANKKAKIIPAALELGEECAVVDFRQWARKCQERFINHDLRGTRAAITELETLCGRILLEQGIEKQYEKINVGIGPLKTNFVIKMPTLLQRMIGVKRILIFLRDLAHASLSIRPMEQAFAMVD